ncbi:hypothetical protein [Amycolatopsis sp. NPDC058986]|uniref:hypothetical protein n=1 Tax=unclassified Amycolatopsis TaxID=2618356 RepID=UPI0036731CA1
MRQGRVLAVAAVALFGLAGCADRPNDLETYYDDPTPTSTPSPASAAAKPPTPAPSRAAVPRTVDPALALLSDEDVAEEEVHPGQGKASGCLGDPAGAAQRSASWLYASGAVLSHQVSAYPDRKGADVVATAKCEGRPVTLPPQPGVSAQRAWCAGGTCTVWLAKGNLVSVLSVAASTEARAMDAAKRLSPLVAGKLVAQP